MLAWLCQAHLWFGAPLGKDEALMPCPDDLAHLVLELKAQVMGLLNRHVAWKDYFKLDIVAGLQQSLVRVSFYAQNSQG